MLNKEGHISSVVAVDSCTTEPGIGFLINFTIYHGFTIRGQTWIMLLNFRMSFTNYPIDWFSLVKGFMEQRTLDALVRQESSAMAAIKYQFVHLLGSLIGLLLINHFENKSLNVSNIKNAAC